METGQAIHTVTIEQRDRVYAAVDTVYKEAGDLPFHGWHHIVFVYRKSAVFADDLGADIALTQMAALVHDLNYLAEKGVFTHPVAGQTIRQKILSDCGLSFEVIETIENIVITAEIGKGHDGLSLEAKALSDADTLFKALPVTPILFASRFITQTNYNIRKLAAKVISDQKTLIESDTYFYSHKAKTMYKAWAKTNLDLWQSVVESFADPDVINLLQQAGFACDKTD